MSSEGAGTPAAPCRKRQGTSTHPSQEENTSPQAVRPNNTKNNSIYPTANIELTKEDARGFTSRCFKDGLKADYQIRVSRPAYTIPQLRQDLCYQPQQDDGEITKWIQDTNLLIIFKYLLVKYIYCAYNCGHYYYCYCCSHNNYYCILLLSDTRRDGTNNDKRYVKFRL